MAHLLIYTPKRKYFSTSKWSFVFVILYRAILAVYLKEGNVLFNDTFNTFYLQLYGVSAVYLNN